MFIAKDSQQQLVNLWALSKKAHTSLPKKGYTCPACQQEVILKRGRMVRIHFAHKKHSNCLSFSEGETDEHLKGKALLAKWCQLAKQTYQLEAYLPQLAQRPDLLIGQLALEFQCSQLANERFLERTQTYQQHGYQVVWLLGNKFALKDKLGQLQRASLSFHPQYGYYLWTLDVEKAELRLNYHIEEALLTKKLYYSWQVVAAKDFFARLAQLEGSVPRFYQIRRFFLEAAIGNIRQNLTKKVLTKEPAIMALQNFLYKRGYHVCALHPLFFLPVVSQVNFCKLIQMKVLVWEKLLAGQKVECQKLLQELAPQADEKEHLEEEITWWLALLQQLGVSIEQTQQMTLPICLSAEQQLKFSKNILKKMAFDSRLPQKYDMIETIRK